MGITSCIVFVFTSLLFFSGYVLQQRTVRDIRATIKPPVKPHASAVSSFALDQPSAAGFDPTRDDPAATSEAWWYPVPTAEASTLDDGAGTVTASRGAPTAVVIESASSEHGEYVAPSGDSQAAIDPETRVPAPTASPSSSPTQPSRKAIRFGNPLLDPRKESPPAWTAALNEPVATAGTSDEMRR